jgi:hypothetical protein
MSEIKVGLSFEELEAILLEIGKTGEVISPEKVASTIAKAIHENNVRLAHDIAILNIML